MNRIDRLGRPKLQITAETRLNRVLDTIPGALEYIVSLNPHYFGRLRNSVMRRYMSPRISLRRMAAMARVELEQVIRDLLVLSAEQGAEQDDEQDDEQADRALALPARYALQLRSASSSQPSQEASPLPQSPVIPPPWMSGVDKTHLH